MPFWLVKTEPSTYSFQDLVRDGTTRWDGVSNNTALIHLRAMKKGDTVFIYHSGAAKAVVGTAKVARGPYADPNSPETKLVVIDLAAGAPLGRPVTLQDIKSRKEFAGFDLTRISRLSVMPVSDAHASLLRSLGKSGG